MKLLSNNQIKYIVGATGNELIPFTGSHNLTTFFDREGKTDFRTPSIAAGLLVLTFGLNTAATATLKPSIPLWGIPVTLSIGVALFGTVLLLGQSIDWMQSDF